MENDSAQPPGAPAGATASPEPAATAEGARAATEPVPEPEVACLPDQLGQMEAVLADCAALDAEMAQPRPEREAELVSLEERRRRMAARQFEQAKVPRYVVLWRSGYEPPIDESDDVEVPPEAERTLRCWHPGCRSKQRDLSRLRWHYFVQHVLVLPEEARRTLRCPISGCAANIGRCSSEHHLRNHFGEYHLRRPSPDGSCPMCTPTVPFRDWTHHVGHLQLHRELQVILGDVDGEAS